MSEKVQSMQLTNIDSWLKKGEKVGVTRPDGSYFFGLVLEVSDSHLLLEDTRKHIKVLVPRLHVEIAEMWGE